MSLRGKIRSFLENSIIYFRIRSRINFAKLDIKTKQITLDITNSEKYNIKSYWKPFRQNINYRFFAFYKQFCTDNSTLKYYIPDDIYYSMIDSYFNDLILTEKYDNKNLYDLYFNDIKQPRTICRYYDGVFKDEKYSLIDEKTAILKCKNAGQVIIKPAIESSGGDGIKFWHKSSDSVETLLKYIKSSQNCIISEVISQHKILSEIHPNSVNTIRFITLLWKGQVHALSAILRMGRGGAKVDNASSGGIFCGINKDGSLKRYAYDTKGNSFDGHPSGYILEGTKLPNFDSCSNLVLSLAPRFSHISKLCSWDIAIGEDAKPILIECNMAYGELDFHQICNGPIFGNQTTDILEHIFIKNS